MMKYVTVATVVALLIGIVLGTYKGDWFRSLAAKVSV